MSPAVVSVDAGDTVVLGFRIVVNSYGGVQSNREIGILFNSSTGVRTRRLFQSNSSQPYNYYRIITSATESDGGIYTAMVFSKCNYMY